VGSIKKQIYNKIKTIVDNYRSRDISTIDIKKHFSSNRNFKELLKSLSEMNWAYEKEKEEGSEDFVNVVRNYLFNRILPDRMYHEKDNPILESFVMKSADELKNIIIKTKSIDNAYDIFRYLNEKFGIGFYEFSTIREYLEDYWSEYRYICLYKGKLSLCNENYNVGKVIIDDFEIGEYKPRIKKLNLEDDPFGEEDWGYLED